MRTNIAVACALACASCGRDYAAGAAAAGSTTDPSVDAGASDAVTITGDLPCDVHAVLAAHCTSCHGDPPTSNAPYSLVTYSDLVRTVNGAEVAQRALARMQSATVPMPPPPATPVTASELATFSAWVTAATPSGDPNACTVIDPLDAPPTCTTGTFWTMGDTPSPLMRPGAACIACHPMQNIIAGTVYATGHEPDNCNGAAGATVTITDATGAMMSLTTNAAGNFFVTTTVAFPIHAEVVTTTGTRAMVHAQPSGDCNACHTQAGANGAPGRVTLP